MYDETETQAPSFIVGGPAVGNAETLKGTQATVGGLVEVLDFGLGLRCVTLST